MTNHIGIDVGGTNTDAVVVSDSGNILRWAKEITTSEDVTEGVKRVIRDDIQQIVQQLTSSGS
jgi:N-methylhydantoinase A/oxoprolinase/acetone carboxylase beta subunit